MGRDIPLGRIAGIKVGMSPSVLVVAALYTWLLAIDRFPFEQPGHADRTYWIAGACGALLLFVSLMVHEIGHGLVARDEGIGVRSMGLTLLGGVTRMESSPPTAGAELRVSIIGPLASFSWGIALLCMAYVCPDDGTAGLIGAVLSWAGFLNLILGAFNLLPATPLDGGKVLSSLIWLKTGSQAVAIRWTARIGMAAGAALIVLGVRDLQSDGGGSFGLWYIIGGSFVLMGAFREHQTVPLYEALQGVTVTEAMATQPPVVAGWTTVADFLRTAGPGPDQRAFPVVGPDGKVEGVLTAGAIQAVPSEQWETLTAKDLAFPLDRVVRLDPSDALLSALQRVDASPSRTGIVVDRRGEVVGTVEPSVLHRALQQRRAGLVDVES